MQTDHRDSIYQQCFGQLPHGTSRMTVSALESWKAVQLYGGAITAQFPSRFLDISDFRPVPDHQEVWADGETDQSVVVEIAEHSIVADADVGRFVFDDLSAANEASNSSIKDIRQLGAADVPNMPSGMYTCLVTGIQQVCKGRDTGPQRANIVHVMLCVIRLPQQGTDLLVTVNAPTYISPNSSAAQHTETEGQQPAAQAQAASIMQGVLRSIRVEDWGLFGA